MSVKPLGHYVLVRPQKLEDIDPAFAAAQRMGLEFAGLEKRKEQIAVSKGTVLELGLSAYADMQGGMPWCAEGDLVAYVGHGGMYVEDPDTKEELLLLNDSDIVALLKKEKND